MFRQANKYIYLAVAICFFATAAITENSLLSGHPENKLVKNFQNQLLKSEFALETRVGEISGLATAKDFDGSFFDALNQFTMQVGETGTGYLVYQSGKLVYWSDRALSFYNSYRDYRGKFGLLKLQNGYFLSVNKKAGDVEIIGLQLIKHNYEHVNKYLGNSFFEVFRIPDSFNIVENQQSGTFPIVDSKGNYLFSLKPGGDIFCMENQLYFPAILYFLGLIVLLLYFRKEFYESDAPFFLKLFLVSVVLFILFWLHSILKIPALFTHITYFSPAYFALNELLPSLGDYFIMVLFISFFLYVFADRLDIEEISSGSNTPKKLVIALLLLFSGGLFILANYLTEILVYNSTISFAMNKIIDITSHSLFGIFSVGMLLMVTLIFLVKVINEASNSYSLKNLIFLISGIALVIAFIQLISVGKIYFAVLALFVISAVLALVFKRKDMSFFSLNYLVTFVFLGSLYSLVIFNETIGKKDRESQQLFAVTLTAERDPAAEQYLARIEKQIKNDPAIISLLIQKEDLREYIHRTYFSGYFKKYIFEMYTCTSTDSLIIDNGSRTVLCRSFMQSLIDDMGVQIADSSFYFMDDMNGRISYTGKFNFPLPNNSDGITIFIDLDSDVLYEGIGFPELLIDKSITRSENYRKFNYAKYYSGELTDRLGDFSYNLYVDSYEPEDKEISTKRWDGYEHLFYHTRENNFIIVSRKLLTVIDYLISFPYLFVFYFLMALGLYFIRKRKLNLLKFEFNLKMKIQAAIIAIVFFSLLMVALATILYNVKEYRQKHQNDLNEKMKSISEEINLRLESKDEISPQIIDWLSVELSKLSNIFQTDINIYGTDGNLLTSSRLEIFQRGLVSSRMNAEAYYEIFQNFQYNNYFQPENIGKLSYLSVYKPIINNRGQIIGSINLPYFISQDKYSQEITTFIVAFINLYVMLLMLSIVIAVFISNQLTHPLVLIQEKLKKMELGKYNEPIYYRGNDEIGSLVKEYNKKVDELAVSAELLARSERESAWREMAKQIAHEIKNPLTPMKLNIQHLQQLKGRGKDYNEYMERVTATLIEQIDNLSNIATEFSNFAQIPTARNQVFNLTEQLTKVISLFESGEKAIIHLQNNKLTNILVNADREQLSRAIINLIKNAIQSIPENEEGKIDIVLNRKGKMAVIAITDNGTGIPAELRDKLFSPSFTTKTSGMGLGLAIVKNIVENFSGRVWFETETGTGSTFYLEIPVFNEIGT